MKRGVRNTRNQTRETTDTAMFFNWIEIQKHNLFGDERAAETLKQGIQQGIQQKAIEDAVTIIKEFKISPELASNKMGAPLEKVLEALSSEKLEK